MKDFYESYAIKASLERRLSRPRNNGFKLCSSDSNETGEHWFIERVVDEWNRLDGSCVVVLI